MSKATRRRAQKLRRLYDLAVKENRTADFYDNLEEATREEASSRNLAREFSVRELFEAFVDDGAEYLRNCRQADGGFVGLREAADLVDTSKFANINGQIVYSAMLEAFDDPQYIGESLVTNVPTQFNGEKIPGIARVGDDSGQVSEGEDYPRATIAEEWVETPETIKNGLILDVTLEEVFFDRTGMIEGRASDVGRAIRINKEKRILDVVLGITTTYKRNGKAAVATYQTSDYDNLATSNALQDWTDIETAILKFDGMTDPNTGEPIMVQANTIIVPSALLFTARYIVNATEIRETTNTNTQTLSPNVISPMGLMTNQYVKQRTSSATTWFVGDPRSAFAYMENWPLRVQTQDDTSQESFNRDIVARYKASERGAVAVKEPRYMVKSTA